MDGYPKYIGNFKRGFYSNYGTLYRSNGNRLLQGKWKIFKDTGVPMSKLHGSAIEYESDGMTIKKQGTWEKYRFVRSSEVSKTFKRRFRLP